MRFFNKWRKITLSLSITVCLLASSEGGFADTSSTTNIFTSFLQALSQVIGQALSSSSSSSVGSLANLINILTNSKSTDAGLSIQSSYIPLGNDSNPGLEEGAQGIAQPVGQILAQQFAGLANPFKAQLASYKNIAGQKTVCTSLTDPNGNSYKVCTPEEYCEGKSSDSTCYSPISSNTLFQNDVYDSTQQAAAYAYLQNVSGALMGIRKPNAKWKQTQAVVKYNAYYQTIAALQSMSANTLAYSYALRVPQSDSDNASLQQQYESILQGNATNSKYWSEINSLPVIGQLAMVVYQLPALMIGISRITDLLEQISGSLAALNISNGILSQMTFGEQMYSDAQNSQNSSNNNQSKTYTVSDKDNQSSSNNSSVSS